MRRYFLAILSVLLIGCESVKIKKEHGQLPKQEEKSYSVSFGQEEILATDMSFDVKTGEIKYTLPQEAIVRIRIGLRDGGPLLLALLDWEIRSAGPHVEVWDKRDRTGQVIFGERGDYMVVVSCKPISAQGKKGVRKSPDLRITFPESHEATAEGTPILKGTSPVRIILPEEEKKWFNETKYELGIYIDTVFLMEDEEGTDPFTYQLNTENFSEGVHTLTINLVGYEGEVGTKSVLIFVKNH